MAVAAAVLLSLGSAAGLVSGLGSCAPGGPQVQESPRPLTTAEAVRLASMRQHNLAQGSVAITATIGSGATELALSGWVDWRQPLAYLAVAGRTASAADGLVQAVPGTIAVRPGRIEPTPPASPAPVVLPMPHPPANAPEDGWRLRAFGKTGREGSPLDGLLALLFVVAHDRPDAADRLAEGQSRWVRRDHAGTVPVDVLLGPAVPPTPGPDVMGPFATPTPSGPPPLSAQGGAVFYWLDEDGGLRRLEATVGQNLPLRVDFERAGQPDVVAIPEFGGRLVHPRDVTRAEAGTLALLRQRDRAAGGGRVELTLPSGAGNTVTGSGWLDWRSGTAYLLIADTQNHDQVLVRADRTGVNALKIEKAPADGLPPLPPPRGQWERAAWAQRIDQAGVTDFDLLVSEALSLASGYRDDQSFLSGTAAWLRADVFGGVPVTGYEVPKREERGLPKGMARLRYWIDDRGVLRRVEVRVRSGGFGRLELTQGTVPYLAPVRA